MDYSKRFHAMKPFRIYSFYRKSVGLYSIEIPSFFLS